MKRENNWKEKLRNITDKSGMTFIDNLGQYEVVELEKFIDNTLEQQKKEIIEKLNNARIVSSIFNAVIYDAEKIDEIIESLKEE